MLNVPKILVLIFLSFIVFATSAIFRWDPFSVSHDEQRSVELVLTFAVGLVCLFGFLRSHAQAQYVRAAVPNIVWVSLGIFFGLGLLSAALATLPTWAFLEWGHFFLLVVLCFALSFAFDKTARVEHYLFLAMILAASIYALQVAMQYLVSVTFVHKLNNNVLVVGYSHRRYMAQFNAVLIPMFGAAYFKYAFQPGRIASWAKPGLILLAGLSWMLCFVGASRGAAVSLAASVLILLLISRANRKQWLKFYAISLLVGALLVGVFFMLMPELLGATMTWENRLADTGPSPDPSIPSARVFLWTKALGMMMDSPLLGVGPMHFSYYFHEEGAHPHNLAVQLAAEWGLIAMLCFVGILIYGYISFAKFARARADVAVPANGLATTEGILAVLTIIAVYSMIDGLFVMPYSQMWVVLFIAWAMSIVRVHGIAGPAIAQQVNVKRKIFRITVVLALLIALSSVAMFGLTGIGKTSQRSEIYQEAATSGVLYPRFWVQGWIGPLPKAAPHPISQP